MEMLSFGTLEFRRVGNKVVIEGPSDHLAALKKHLELHGLRPAARRDTRLEIEHGRDTKRVQELVDEWTL